MSKPDFKRVEELFHRAAALDSAEWRPFLEDACAGDGELLAAVEDLLKHDRAEDPTDRFLVSPVAGEAEHYRPEAATIPGPPYDPAPSAGEPLPMIPSYEVVAEAGGGGT